MSNSTIISIDPGLTTGFAIFTFNRKDEYPVLSTGIIKGKGKTRFDKILSIVDKLDITIRKHMINLNVYDLVDTTAYAVWENVTSTRYKSQIAMASMSQLEYAIRYAFTIRDFNIIDNTEYYPMTLKKRFTGNGASKKDAVIEEVIKKYGEVIDIHEKNIDNIADALQLLWVTLNEGFKFDLSILERSQYVRYRI